MLKVFLTGDNHIGLKYASHEQAAALASCRITAFEGMVETARCLIMFEPWQLTAMDDAGYNGIRDEHIDWVAESLLATGLPEIDRRTFDYHCHKCGVNPNNFTQADLDRLREKLNG